MFHPDDIIELDKWLDDMVAPLYKEQPLAQDWARLSKIGEELGEAINAFIGVTGQNPRKGTFGSESDVNDELVDVALTAILCLQHRTQSIIDTQNIIQERMRYRMRKAGL